MGGSGVAVEMLTIALGPIDVGTLCLLIALRPSVLMPPPTPGTVPVEMSPVTRPAVAVSTGRNANIASNSAPRFMESSSSLTRCFGPPREEKRREEGLLGLELQVPSSGTHLHTRLAYSLCQVTWALLATHCPSVVFSRLASRIPARFKRSRTKDTCSSRYAVLTMTTFSSSPGVNVSRPWS